jgi:ribose-phosphate pyrophosphokinase
MLANLLGVAGVKHVITVDLHASQMQGFFKCPVDNLHAEPIIARWIKHNVANWKEAVVVSKNAGGTKRVTSLADALKLNFGMVTADKKRGSENMTSSMIMSQLDDLPYQPTLTNGNHRNGQAAEMRIDTGTVNGHGRPSSPIEPRERLSTSARPAGGEVNSMPQTPYSRRSLSPSPSSAVDEGSQGPEDAAYNDQRAEEVTQARFVQGHIVPDDFPSPTASTADGSLQNGVDDPMALSYHSASFPPEALARSGEGGEQSEDEEEDNFHDPRLEHMITLVGNVRDRTVLIVDDMIDKPGSWIAAAETVVKKGGGQKVYCIATHGLFGGDCLEQMEACDCIDAIVVTNSYPLRAEQVAKSTKLAVLDLSFLLAEAIRRNHYGESISPLFQHIPD